MCERSHAHPQAGLWLFARKGSAGLGKIKVLSPKYPVCIGAASPIYRAGHRDPLNFSLSPGSAGSRCDHSDQLDRFDRFRDVHLKARGDGLNAIIDTSVSSQRDSRNSSAAGCAK